MEHASFACLVTETSTGKTIGKYQPDVQLTPASVLKLLTTATALELLGETYRFQRQSVMMEQLPMVY